ncbi:MULTISPECIES: hypothetical protein [Flavobacterium]|uniref:Natural product, GG-Bacteroidales family domain protein n=1 Tax=Flavobacterium hankyongi TaxID=1176532 RepID=A0ABP8ZMM0_9FLAO|nr:hypothetical protein [Flavobacterium sp. N1846]
MKSLKQLKEEGFCLSREELKEIKGELYNNQELSYYKDTINPSDCMRCAATTYPDGTHEPFNCVVVNQ